MVTTVTTYNSWDDPPSYDAQVPTGTSAFFSLTQDGSALEKA